MALKLCSRLNIKDVVCPAWRCTSVAGFRNWKPLPPPQEIEYPKYSKWRLKFVERTPQPTGFSGKHLKMSKRLMDMRGPEEYHTFLLHKQFGIRAKMGGMMHWGHMDMIRLTINRKMDQSRMFAIWRVDPPWKPITKKGQGHRMGGGKGSIDKFVAPVKAGRIIVEMGGDCEFDEVFPILEQVRGKLPFKAEVVSQKMLDEEKAQEEYVKKNNMNPFSFEYCLKNNMMGSRVWSSPYDFFWNGKHR
ncbi:hypothetical protein LSH36_963g00000 [Paralvinella palmiformis]|uniref:Large ribosomal subunit protein uL16m n=1 Tax=Paralvinella palmiformis TaxID=53620 RepID=A0AAD9MSN2_9ANNE|nr:hypothetical protein LSH36_963g00000 [Paralvinella palmiformis]